MIHLLMVAVLAALRSMAAVGDNHVQRPDAGGNQEQGDHDLQATPAQEGLQTIGAEAGGQHGGEGADPEQQHHGGGLDPVLGSRCPGQRAVDQATGHQSPTQAE